MTTSLTDLLGALDGAVAGLPDHPAARADVAAALGHLGRALTLLKVAGISNEVGDERERRVATLGMVCTGLAARAPMIEGRVAALAAASADTIGVLRDDTGVPARWAITVEVIDAVATLADHLERGPGATPAADWVREIQNRTVWAQRHAALHPPPAADCIILDRALPTSRPWESRDTGTVITAATAALVHATRKAAPPLSIAAVLAVSVACQTLSSTARALRLVDPDRPEPGRYAPGRASAASGELAGAASGWEAIRAALQPFHDASTRPLRISPRTAVVAGLAVSPTSAITAARILHEQLIQLTYRPAILTDATVEAIIAAAQHLPVLAQAIAQNTTAWHTNATVMAFARDLPQRETRLPQYLAGYRADGLVHADPFDLAPVVTAADHTRLLSAVLAADVARPAETQPVSVSPSPTPSTAPTARHLTAANRVAVANPDVSAQIGNARHDTFARLQQAQRSPGPRRGR